MFLKNSWYVFSWDYEVTDKPVGRVIIEQPIVVWRNADGQVMAAEDRCPHRHAPLSFGRIEGNQLRCMYHGMKFNEAGECIEMPLMDTAPKCSIRMYPVVEKDSWIWVWTGDPNKADIDLIPTGWGINDPNKPMNASSIEYDANYQLVHDNLTDLSHLDFVHATTLRPITGAYWAESEPEVTPQGRSIKISRWFLDCDNPANPDARLDAWSSYDFVAPGIFILYGARFPAGTAEKCDFKEPKGIKPLFENIEQQAVTPIGPKRTAYHFATGLIMDADKLTDAVKARMAVVKDAFNEDRAIIEAQQKIWDLTPEDHKKQFLPIDKAPTIMRRMMAKLIRDEQE